MGIILWVNLKTRTTCSFCNNRAARALDASTQRANLFFDRAATKTPLTTHEPLSSVPASPARYRENRMMITLEDTKRDCLGLRGSDLHLVVLNTCSATRGNCIARSARILNSLGARNTLRIRPAVTSARVNRRWCSLR